MPKVHFSKRTTWQASANRINDSLEDLRRQKVEVLDLSESNPTACGFLYPNEILPSLTMPQSLAYQPDSKGMLHTRREVATYYQSHAIHIDPEHIVLTSSTSEAYSFLFRLLVNPQEKVLIPAPSYPLFQFLLELNDARFDYYPLVYDGSTWRLDREALLALVDAETKAIVVVNPNNPTGSYLNKSDWEFLNTCCLDHGMAIISDEVFFDYATTGGEFTSAASNAKALTFVLSGISKILGLPQMKCAWIAAMGPKESVEEALSRLEIIADTYLSVNTPVQHALGSWLCLMPKIQGQIMERVRVNGDFLRQHLDPHAQLLNTQGGWYALLRIPAIFSEEEWVLTLLNKDHVLVHPGYFFDFKEEAYIVLSLIPKMDVFQQGCLSIMKRIAHETRHL